MPGVDDVYNRLSLIDDPELGLSLVDLGLIYDVIVEGGKVQVIMTLTTQGCPLHDTLIPAVEAAVGSLPGVASVEVDLVWEPRWTPERLSPAGALALGWNEATGRKTP